MMGDLRPPLEDAILELFQADPRPTFIVELPQDGAFTTAVRFSNDALEADPSLHDAILDVVLNREGQFWAWILAQPDAKGHREPKDTTSYMDHYWTRSIFRTRYVIVSSNEQRRPNTPQRPKIRHNDRSHTLLRVPAANSGNGSANESEGEEYTVPGLTPEQEEPFVLTVNSSDWSSTPLGPMTEWPVQLHQTFNQILADSRPIVLYWGTSLTTLYNEAFAKLCGAKHPGLLGKPLKDAWPDFSDKIHETMRKATTKRHASEEEEWRFFIEKADGSLEETYLKWSIVPIVAEREKENLGFLQPVSDTTKMRLWDRRMNLLIDLGESVVTARDAKSYWRKTLEALEACEPSYDIPLAILYSVEGNNKVDPNSSQKAEDNSICRLQGSLGVPKNHPLAPSNLALSTSECGLSWAFREAIRTRDPIVISTKDGTLPEDLLHGVHWRGFEDPSHEAIVLPIRPTKDERVMGLLVLGLNPRQPYALDYQQFISLLNQKLETTLASVVLLEEESRRNRNISEQAAYDRAKLKEKLAVQTKEANEWVAKFQAIAELIPVGMCFGSPEGEISFANDAWHNITGVTKSDSLTQQEFFSRVVEEDRQTVARAYRKMKDTGTVNLEFRIYRDDDAPLQQPIGSSPAFEKVGLDFGNDSPRERYISAALKAEIDPDGTVIRIFACMTDVTLHKKAADAAIRKASQAENLKKLAENASVGMYEMHSDGRLIWANSTFFEMCGMEKVDLSKQEVRPFESCVVEEDMPLLQQALERLTTKGKKASAEIRLNTLWSEEDFAGNKIVAPRCILASFRPVKTSGVIETFTGCLVDMTLQRQQFEVERQRKDEAIESKRQQENFIDMTSHEMRNPLSAIVQCADSVVASSSRGEQILKEAKTESKDGPFVLSNDAHIELLHLLSTCIDNAETIDICAQHQRHIVDDILTMSKMDSDLLAISSATVDPRVVATESLKMFEVEARRVDINLTMTIDKAYDDLNIEFLDFDPSRLRQVLINLLTNALKFTKSQATRNVSIKLSACKDRPTDNISALQYIPHTTDASLIQVEPETTDAEVVYLTFEVKDTGQGLTDEEKSSLFQRFVQASPKTHVKYGGSGLGLFISKRLTEMLGGQIGVASRPGHGSTFAFYIAAMVPGPEALKEARATAKTVAPAIPTPTSSMGSKHQLAESTRRQTVAPSDNLVRGVLIVEDNLINQQITRRGLVDKGYKIEVANHGMEALDKLKLTDRMEGPFPLDVVMMDMEMPIMDGLTCTRNIRELEKDGKLRGPRIPIIAVSANARTEQIQEAKAAGCDDVLVKPYKIPELIKVMQRLARRMDGPEVSPAEKPPAAEKTDAPAVEKIDAPASDNPATSSTGRTDTEKAGTSVTEKEEPVA